MGFCLFVFLQFFFKILLLLVQQGFDLGLFIFFSVVFFHSEDCNESAACSWMACRDSKFIATTLKPCKNSHIEHKSSVLLRALLLVANREHSIFNKQFTVFCICPWHSTSGRETALCMCANQMFVTEAEDTTMKKVWENELCW